MITLRWKASLAGKANRANKLQDPNTKFQIRSKHQAPSVMNKPFCSQNTNSCGPSPLLGIWSLGFLWSLELGVWSFFALFKKRDFHSPTLRLGEAIKKAWAGRRAGGWLGPGLRFCRFESRAQ